jgi:hypothetical protein
MPVSIRDLFPISRLVSLRLYSNADLRDELRLNGP